MKNPAAAFAAWLALSLAPTSTLPAAAAARGKDEAIALSVFEVSATKDESYSALNTNSVTRFAVEMDKLPITAPMQPPGRPAPRASRRNRGMCS